jgi:3'-phosphoadenosine 5'-phosphosulfate (PAPS) 3'-phosphatase
MVTMLMEKLNTGDVIEVKTNRGDGDFMTTLVLLATEEFMILDPCDGTTPFVVERGELTEYRKFDGA